MKDLIIIIAGACIVVALLFGFFGAKRTVAINKTVETIKNENKLKELERKWDLMQPK